MIITCTVKINDVECEIDLCWYKCCQLMSLCITQCMDSSLVRYHNPFVIYQVHYEKLGSFRY